jgi:hypothetical protein
MNPTKIHAAVDTVLEGKWKVGCLPQLWDGHAPESIVDFEEEFQ